MNASERIYLDYAASTPISNRARSVLFEHLGLSANASSVHTRGRTARKALEQAREQIAQLCGAHPTEVIFTASGTESNNIAVKGLYWKQRAKGRNRILIGATEHHAILDVAQWLADHHDARLTIISANSKGIITPEAFDEAIGSQYEDIALASVMWVNNELGSISPIESLAQIAENKNFPFHCDAVAATGHTPISFADTRLSALSLSGHKFGGPLGVGAVIIRRDTELEPLIHGGGHERGIRSGSHNYASIAAMAAALNDSLTDYNKKHDQVWFLRQLLVDGILNGVHDAQVNGVANYRSDLDAQYQLPNILNVSFSHCEGESLLMLLDSHGIDCSIGAACSAGVTSLSHVLQAIGAQSARNAVRFSFDSTLALHDVDRVINVISQIVPTAKCEFSK